MYTVYLVMGLGVILGIILNQRDIAKNIKFSIGEYISGLCFAGSIFLFIGIIVAGILGTFLPTNEKIVTKTIYLHTVQDNNSISGSFFLGSGNIDNTWMYTYYYKSGNGYKLGSENANRVKIVYTDGSPRIEWHKTIRLGSNWYKWALYQSSIECNSERTFYIPEGSIKNSYNLDAD